MIKLSKCKIIPILLGLNLMLFTPYKAYAITNNDVKHNNKIINQQVKGNNYPIVMVHGLFGWGNDEVLGTNYWGGHNSLRESLNSKGYEVYTPSIGPVASNWDRACELYAYLKGGRVDYGEAHSKKCGHDRYGRTFEGVCPSMGTAISENGIQKVHLIGHSMGGQTVRTLAQLLENGSEEEIMATPKNQLNELFKGGKSWIASITSIATPHDGSQVDGKKYDLEPMVHKLVAALCVKNNVINNNEIGIDYKLDQWGLKKEEDESYRDYFKKVHNSNIWQKTNDLSIWDLAPEGARELNQWVKAQKDIYYFSIACKDTHEASITHHQVPNSNMESILKSSSLYMGRYINNTPGEVKIDSSWWENDGVVSVVSAISPKVGSTDKVVNYNGQAQKGVWNYLGLIDNVDHIEVVGQFLYQDKLEKEFFKLAKMLSELPQ